MQGSKAEEPMMLEITPGQGWLIAKALCYMTSKEGVDRLFDEHPNIDVYRLGDGIEDLLEQIEECFGV
jgi:hypothetical protein